ncbi:glycosyl transferase family protein [Devosia sp. RR2S18]|uniref:glycosyl transferase family protein n=1 Tax=Devosia rhizosphaerae TaxID=3049774 RepID=UPI002541C501|nr:glycosyl transferase family protein [Devosia sp. RR2S18]WIJ24248.1 glycosyl transferase family protein [Devosia sp. RR2S18]
MSQFIFYLATYQQVIELLAVAVTVLILLSSLDDLFVDAWYWSYSFYRWFWARAIYPRLTAEQLDARPEQPIALMVPAWHESEVIGAMLAASNRLIRYSNYRIFVGVYQNDPDTIAEVRAAMERFPNVQMSVVPRDGPTNKADCLNVVLGDIFAYERSQNTRFAGVALHDSEDVIHPYELKLFNHLLGRMDLIQLPVYSFPRGIEELVAGTYMDEFAEWHSKDLVVRESMTGVVPCAGVSACFSRRAIDALRAERAGEVFSTTSLTEDYDIAFRLAAMGMREIFVKFPIGITVDQRGHAGAARGRLEWLPVATREYFPSDFRAAYRQRARWLLGIAFQGWSQHGWEGSLGHKYFLLRDRKGLITAPAAIIAYYVMLNFLALNIVFSLVPPTDRPPFLLLNADAYAVLLMTNLVLLGNRLLQRSIFTARLYGPLQGMMAGPRMVVSNLLNFFALARAISVFARHKLTGAPIVWDKTTHSYPTG